MKSRRYESTDLTDHDQPRSRYVACSHPQLLDPSTGSLPETGRHSRRRSVTPGIGFTSGYWPPGTPTAKSLANPVVLRVLMTLLLTGTDIGIRRVRPSHRVPLSAPDRTSVARPSHGLDELPTRQESSRHPLTRPSLAHSTFCRLA